MAYTIIPGVDPATYEFPPEILTALQRTTGHYKGNLPAGATMDSLSTGAYYVFSSSAESIGLPKDRGGLLEIYRSGAGGVATLTSAQPGDQVILVNTRTTLGWQEWTVYGDYHGTLSENTTKDELKAGTYWTTPSISQKVLDINSSGRLDVVWFTSAIGILKLTTGNKTKSDVLVRVRDVNGWGNWQHTIDSDAGGSKNTTLVDDMVRRMGGITVSDTGAVCIRYDHGLKNFYNEIWPIHKALKLPFTIALSSRGWEQSENEGVTPAMMNTIAADPLCEIANHGAVPHVGSKDELVWRDYIEGGLSELRSQIPNADIDSFIVPGTSSVGFGDFITGATISEINSYAGQFILSKHALLTGALSGTAEHPLDGVVRQGMSHNGFGENSLSSFQSQINTLINNKTGGTKMMHPSQLNTSGFDTTAQLRAKLEWLAAQRDAGRIQVVQLRKLQTLNVLKNVDGSFPVTSKDTGVRNIASLLTGASAVGSATLQRTGNLVEVYLYDTVPNDRAGASSIVLGNLPLGFRPPASRWTPVPATSSELYNPQPMRQAAVSPAGNIQVYGSAVTDRYRVQYTYLTRDPWPTTLPGTPV